MSHKVSQFKKLSLMQRYEVLRSNGTYLASRRFSGYNVHLYQCFDYYVEAWMRIDLNQVCWIEPVSDEQAVDNYLGIKDMLKELGL